MDSRILSVDSDENGNLVVAGGERLKKSGVWAGKILAEDLLLVCSQTEDEREEDLEYTFGSSERLYDTLQSLAEKKWTGSIEVYSEVGNKRIFFHLGNVVFATADGMDDRLGEVIYRDGLITMDAWTDLAAHVTRGKKFGQVMLDAGIFTHFQLWRALGSQVQQILVSIFMVEKVFFRLRPNVKPHTQVMLPNLTPKVLSESYQYGCIFNAFKSRLQEECVLVAAEGGTRLEVGCYYGDVLSLLEGQCTLSQYIERCRLAPHYAIAALMYLWDRKMILIEGLMPLTFDFSDEQTMSHFNRLVQNYRSLISGIHALFQSIGKDFPSGDLGLLVAEMGSSWYPEFFLDSECYLDSSSIAHLMVLCAQRPKMVEHYRAFFEEIGCYLLQICQNSMVDSKFKDAKELFRKYMTDETSQDF